jgi:hypothetical protein
LSKVKQTAQLVAVALKNRVAKNTKRKVFTVKSVPKCKVKSCYLWRMKASLCILFVFSSLLSFSQSVKRVELGYKWNDADFFAGLSYKPSFHFPKTSSLEKKPAFEPFVGLHVGVIRTFFQQRFFPAFSGGATYYLLQNKAVSIGPRVSADYMVLKYNAQTNAFMHRTHYTLGYQVTLGKEALFFTHHIAVGLKNEYWNSSMTQNTSHHRGLLLELNVGLAYTLKREKK